MFRRLERSVRIVGVLGSDPAGDELTGLGSAQINGPWRLGRSLPAYFGGRPVVLKTSLPGVLEGWGVAMGGCVEVRTLG